MLCKLASVKRTSTKRNISEISQMHIHIHTENHVDHINHINHIDTMDHAACKRPRVNFDVNTCYLTSLALIDTEGAEKFSAGRGLAFSPSLNLIAISIMNCAIPVQAFSLVVESSTRNPVLVRKWSYAGAPKFKFMEWYAPVTSGYLAFIEDHPRRPLLLVTDHGNDAVHILDPVCGGQHLGYMTRPGTIKGPRGVSAQGSVVAISYWGFEWFDGSGVITFQRDGDLSWIKLWCVPDLPFAVNFPDSIRISRDGNIVAVARRRRDGGGSVAILDARTGKTMENLRAEMRGVLDIEEHPDCDGWLVSFAATRLVENTIDFVMDQGLEFRQVSLPTTSPPGIFPHCRLKGDMLALALVPGLGLIAASRTVSNTIRSTLLLYTTPDLIGMATMTEARLSWMAAVVRRVQQQ